MATTRITEETFTGTGYTTNFPFQIEYEPTQTHNLKVYKGGVLQTETTHYKIEGTELIFVSAPAANDAIILRRDTSVNAPLATYSTGATLRSVDLNRNHDQLLFHAQEMDNKLAATEGLVDGSITDVKINSNAAIAGTKISPNFGSQDIVTTGSISALNTNLTGNVSIVNSAPTIFLTDNNNTPDYAIRNDNGVFKIIDSTNNADRFTIAGDTDGEITCLTKLTLNNGIVLPTTSKGIKFGAGDANNDDAHIEWLGGDNNGSLRISTSDDSDASVQYSELIEFGDYENTDKGGNFTQWVKLSRGSFQFNGDISVTGEVDGRDIASDGQVLDNLASNPGEVNQNAFSNVAVSGQTTVAADSKTDTLNLAAGSNVTITTNATNDTITIAATDTNTTYSVGDGGLTQNNFTNTLKTKLDSIEAGADVTDATNVNAAGAVMNSDLNDKGKLLVGIGPTDPGTLDVGTDGTVLTADSNAASGLAWSTVSSGEQNVQSDWNQTSNTADDFIKNKPTLFSGSYNDLTSKPTLFSGNYSDLTNKPTLFSGNYNDLTNRPSLYDNNDVSHHLNTATASSGQILSWDGSDFEWANPFSGSYNDLTNRPSLYDNNDVDIHLNKSTASSGQILSWNGSDYAWVNDATGGGGGGSSIGGATGVDFNDNVQIRFGNSNDLAIFHNSNNSIINETGTGNLQLQTGGSTKLEVIDTGVNFTGNLSITNDRPTITFTDNNSSPDYAIRNDDGFFKIIDLTNNADRIAINTEGSISLYSDVSISSDLTMSGGNILAKNITALQNITVTGTVDGRDVAADGTKLDGIDLNANNYSLPKANTSTLGGIIIGTGFQVDTSTGTVNVDFSSNSSSGSVTSNSINNAFGDTDKLILGNGSTDNNLESNNDDDDALVLYYGTNTGTNYGVISADNGVQIQFDGSTKLQSTTTGPKWFGDLSCDDDSKIKIGTGDDLQLYHSGGQSYITNDTGYLNIKTDEFFISDSTGNFNYISVNQTNTGPRLHYLNAIKLTTTSNGVDVSNRVRCLGSAPSIHLNTDATGANTASRAMFGLAAGNNQFIHGAGSNDVVLNTPHRFLVGHASSEIMAIFDPDGASELYFDAAKKLATLTSGVEITGNLVPNANNSDDIGTSSTRWATIYAVNALNTSDENEKKDITNCDLGLDFVNKINPVSYKWKDSQLGSKTHYGLLAQNIEDAVKSEGKTLNDFGAIHKPEQESMALNYNQLIAPLVKAIQELSDKVAALEAA